MLARASRSRSRSALLAIVALAAGLIGAAVAVVHAEVDRNIYRSNSVGIEVVYPPDWAVSDTPSYPYLLSAAIDRVLGGRMTLSLETLHDGEKLRDCVERNRTVLKKVGFKVSAQGVTQHPTGALVFEVGTPDGRGSVRQAYRAFEDSGPVFVLTLAAPRENMQRYRRAFDDTLRGLTRTRRIAPPPKGEAPPVDTDADEVEPVNPDGGPKPMPGYDENDIPAPVPAPGAKP